ncbi:DUF92 domain-containing protein [Salisaeta longa]|uniref:DUF92 domain-containing protein n=1 Tax=Salisaeta longa TaxID=503170 RepID=UPI0003B662D8|nr:DUF92 domain-containing protein [Salisaeta longa]
MNGLCGITGVALYGAALAAGGVFGVGAYRWGWLTGPAAAWAAGMGATLLMAGPAWAVPALAFFGGSTAWSWAGRRAKDALAYADESGRRRTARQVLANGGVAWLCALGSLWSPHPVWAAAGWAALAAAAADTWATEIGAWVGHAPRNAWTGRGLARGASGGMTWTGSAAAAAGSLSVTAPLLGLVPHAAYDAVLLAGVAGVGGAIADSLLGATVQARYRDPVSGLLVEHPPAPGSAPTRGWPHLRNDAVNLLGTGTAALLASSYYVLLLSF